MKKKDKNGDKEIVKQEVAGSGAKISLGSHLTGTNAFHTIIGKFVLESI